MSKLKPCKSCSKEVSKSAKTCPHCGQKLKGGIGKILMIIFGVFIGLMILGALLGDPESGTYTASEGSKPSTPAVNSNAIFAKMSCGKLLAEISENEAAFVRKYKGKTVQISGAVDSINNSFGGTQVALGSDEEYSFSSCMIYPNKKDEWPFELSKGDRITVTCSSIQEVIGSVNLKKCALN